MKSLIWLVEGILLDEGAQCSVAHLRDFNTIKSRVKHEGISFLTITLPTFSDAFERGLKLGRLTTSDFPSFKCSKRSGCLPAFLQGYTSQVFDKVTGAIHERPSIEAIRAVRQICRFAKKVKIPCTPERVSAAISAFIDCESQVAASDPTLSEYFGYFRAVSWELWTRLFGENFNIHQLVPRHGPGATAERIKGNQKYDFRTWHSRLEPYFPSDAYCSTLNGVGDGALEGIVFSPPEEELPVRVITVPKDLKTPRIIAIEPVCMQYTQQSIMAYLVKTLESNKVGTYTNPAYRRVNFTRQDINQRLARKASKDGSLATLDLSEASDRVPAILVSEMLAGVPDLRDACFACRSTRANVPGAGPLVLPLAKFASMGSALCFPIEAMVFFTIIVASRLRAANAPVTRRTVAKFCRDVHVYGDDIIVPVDEAPTVTRALSSFGMKVNERKSFGSGKFRESCGMDAYDGEQVTPVYLRHMPPANGRSAEAIVSFVSLANQLYLTGMWNTCMRVRQLVEKLVGRLPYVTELSAGLGWISYRYASSIGRWNHTLHRYEVYGPTHKVLKEPDEIDGYLGLMKFFLTVERSEVHNEHLARIGEQLLERLRSSDKLHAKQSVRSGTSYIKRRWFTPF